VTLVPRLDTRDEQAVLDALLRSAAAYLPSWHPQPGGGGFALLEILARFAAILVQSVNGVPTRNFLAFLDAMGVTLLTPRPARAPLVFTLAPDAPVDVPLSIGTEAAAVSPPPLPSTLRSSGPRPPAPASSPIVFRTDEAISLARARLASVHSRLPSTDEWSDHTSALASGFALFDGMSRVPHHLYLAHPLFDFPDEATVVIQNSLARVAGGVARKSLELAWEYLSDSGWLSFGTVMDQTGGLTADGEVRLGKTCGPAPAKAKVNGMESYWLRARVTSPLPMPGGDGTDTGVPALGLIRARVRYTQRGLPLDAASSNSFRVDATKDFLPFGSQPALSATYLFACDEAFKRAGALVELDAPLTTEGKTSGSPQLTWEYSAGPGEWTNLAPTDSTHHMTKKVPAGAPAFSFYAPSSWKKVEVDGETHYWLRVRISSGDYGGPLKYKVDGGTVSPDTASAPQPPVLKYMTVSYTVDSGTLVPDWCLALNAFSYSDFSEDCRWGHRPFLPFQALPDRVPAVYLGFTLPLPIGLVSLYADIPVPDEVRSYAGAHDVAWEYLGPHGWSELTVHDETSGFRESGMTQFIGPPDLASDAGPAGRLYWIRARFLTADATPRPRVLNALHLNATWATQRDSVLGEVVGHSDGSPRLVLSLHHASVLEHETVEVQEWRGTGREWQGLFRDLPEPALRTELDARGNVTAVWVRWQERAHLYSSEAHDRHYTLERSRGLLRFGDGVYGMIPPPGATIAVSYDHGGGPAGNVPPGAISQMYSAVPHVQSVTNPVAAAGGAAVEDVENVKRRGPQRLRHRDRALAASDYEWLAKDASMEVAVARCLSTTGPVGSGQPGWVTLVVAPWSEEAAPRPSADLMRRVRDHLAARAPATVGPRIRIVPPAYLPVSVVTEVTISERGRAAEAIEETKNRLSTFLHPLTGGPRGEGWTFGQAVHLSQIAAVVRGTPGIDRVSRVQLSSEGSIAGDVLHVAPDRLPASGRHLIKAALEV
jgi:hypothetical protein